MTEPLVVLTGAGKRYRQHIDATPLGGGPRRRQHDRDLWALRDVNLALEAGESLGVLGRNGAGKSTLLAMLAGVTAPSEGTVTVRGRIAPLLSVGVGFHQEMTGRENVYINARMLGLGRSAIASKFDGIVDFAGLGSFLDTPVKYYSSGMYARLGFAIASSVEPDLLIIDEVLSVGDYDFQNRSFERMNDLRRSGVAVVLVSHNALALQAFCQRGLVLASGRATYEGSIDQAVTAYGDAIVQGDGEGPQIALTVSRADGSSAAHLEGGDALRATVALDVTGLQNPGLDVVVRKDDLIIHRRRKALEVPSGATHVTVAATLRLPLVTGTYAVTVGSGELQSPSPFPEGARQLVRVNSHREVHGTLDLQARLILT